VPRRQCDAVTRSDRAEHHRDRIDFCGEPRFESRGNARGEQELAAARIQRVGQRDPVVGTQVAEPQRPGPGKAVRLRQHRGEAVPAQAADRELAAVLGRVGGRGGAERSKAYSARGVRTAPH
jgi:hypothetical protein